MNVLAIAVGGTHGKILAAGQTNPTLALYERFASRGDADYQHKLLSAMRFGFGEPLEKPAARGASNAD